ncbi:hypothetical protein [Nonomuraea diastatica]|uniref:hypothetical protein n=1 Tax=Nonomuraea diastatica TaxID=1848329 RepID=UPI00105352CA|nr:hypothetical protein [Nonomuraea diastatica]
MVGPAARRADGALAGAPGERDDGGGRQRTSRTGSRDGAVTVIPDVRASEIEAVKHDGGDGCASGEAVVYVPGGR